MTDDTDTDPDAETDPETDPDAETEPDPDTESEPDPDAETAPDPESGPDAGGPSGSQAGGSSRRTLLRILIALAFGIPILVELFTFLGLIEVSLLGGDGGDGGTTTTTTAETDVGIGDELLPASTPTETVTDAYVSTDTWTFVLAVEVENTGDAPYQLYLTGVTTAEGTQVQETARSDRIDPGATGSVTARWDIPEGEQPDTARAVGITYEDGSGQSVARDVPLSRVPLRGRLTGPGVF